MWAFGVYDLHLSSKQFWHLTLAQLDALTKRYAEGQDWLNYRGALICAVIANCNRTKKGQKAFQPKDFMPKKQRAKEKLSTDEMLEQLRTLNLACGGEEVISEG